MSAQLDSALSRLRAAWRRAVSSLDEDALRDKVGMAAARQAEPGFWDDHKAAAAVLKEGADAFEAMRLLLEGEDKVRDIEEFARLAERENDAEAVTEAIREADDLTRTLRHAVMPDGDERDVFVEMAIGSGMTAAHENIERLARAVMRFAARSGLQAELQDEDRNDTGAVTSVVLRVRGPWALGLLRAEAGLYRFVSPVRDRRQTSFVSMRVTPVRPHAAASIDRAQVRIETMRDSGPGGQHRNTTDSAVRLTHLPTGITAKCARRSQHDNLRDAWSMLAARLEASEQEARLAQARGERLSGPAATFGGGHDRSIFLSPYTLVRDERDGRRTTLAHEWLDGNFAVLDEAGDAAPRGAQEADRDLSAGDDWPERDA